jgi:hypothetical protein
VAAIAVVAIASCSSGANSSAPPFTGIGPAILVGPPGGKGLTAEDPALAGTPVEVSGQLALTVMDRPPTPAIADTSFVVRVTNVSRVDARIDQSVKLWFQSDGHRMELRPCPPAVEALSFTEPIAPKQSAVGRVCFSPASPGADRVLVTEPVSTPNAELDRRYFAAP